MSRASKAATNWLEQSRVSSWYLNPALLCNALPLLSGIGKASTPLPAGITAERVDERSLRSICIHCTILVVAVSISWWWWWWRCWSSWLALLLHIKALLYKRGGSKETSNWLLGIMWKSSHIHIYNCMLNPLSRWTGGGDTFELESGTGLKSRTHGWHR